MRGHYRTTVGADSTHRRAFVHTIELKQRYDNATPSAIANLLKELSARGILSPIGNNTWDVALKEGAWARLLWYPDWNALEVTVSDREVHRLDDKEPYARYDGILNRIAQNLRQHGVTAVGRAVIGRDVVGVFGGALGFHTVGDRDALAEQVKAGFDQLVNEFISRMGVDPSLFAVDFSAMAKDPGGYSRQLQAQRAIMEKSPLYPFWRDVLSPEYEAYKKFYGNLSSWEEFKEDWSTFVNWRDRLESMRGAVNKLLAEQSAKPLQAPVTVAPPSTFTEEAGGLAKRGVEGAGEVAMDLAKVTKYALYGALGIGGLFVIGSLFTTLKKGKEPAKYYSDLYRGRKGEA